MMSSAARRCAVLLEDRPGSPCMLRLPGSCAVTGKGTCRSASSCVCPAHTARLARCQTRSQLARPMPGLTACGRAQLDSFNKASAKSQRRLSRLFSGRKSPKTPSPGGGSTPGTSGAPPALTLEEMLLFQTVSA